MSKKEKALASKKKRELQVPKKRKLSQKKKKAKKVFGTDGARLPVVLQSLVALQSKFLCS